MLQVTLSTIGGYIIECPEQTVIALGRRDEANHQQVDIDFAALAENGVSRLHALLHVGDDGMTIQDLNSRNGTFLNQQQLRPLHKYPLESGDLLVLGRIELTVTINHQA